MALLRGGGWGGLRYIGCVRLAWGGRGCVLDLGVAVVIGEEGASYFFVNVREDSGRHSVLQNVYTWRHLVDGREDPLSSTYTVRLPRELKEKMKKLQPDWSREVRGFIEERVRCLELAETIREVAVNAERRRIRVDSTRLIREDRGRPT